MRAAVVAFCPIQVIPPWLILPTDMAASKLLKNWKILKSDACYNNITIANDKTPKQIQHFQELKRELERRKLQGENNLKIKYVQGVPQITNLN